MRKRKEHIGDARERPRTDYEIELRCEKCDSILWLMFWDRQEYLDHREGLNCFDCDGGNLYPVEKKIEKRTRKDILAAMSEGRS